ncbi:MAG: AraC family transcriptional regulator [Oscillospiraceae bacterium]|nr:AraC family transcriptional regulator [Oscillospiraceae bacterium]
MKDRELERHEMPPHRFNGRRFSVSRADMSPGGGGARHLHEEIEFFYVEPYPGGDGRMRLFVENETFTLRGGEAVLIPPNLSHWAEPAGDSPCACGAVCFHPLLFSGKGYRRFVHPLMFDGRAYVLKLSGETEWQKDALGVLARLARFHDRPDVELWELEFHGLIFILWSTVFENAYAGTAAIHTYQNLYKKLIGPIDYMHGHYQESMTDAVLAEKGNMAVGTFCRYFKKLMGVTPFQYLNEYRILQSRALLVNANRKISEVASLCGYNNVSHFNREFLKYMGCTPSAYRRHETRPRA